MRLVLWIILWWTLFVTYAAFAIVAHAPQPIVPQRGQVEMWDGTKWRPVTLKLVCTPAGFRSTTLTCTAVLP